MSSSAMDILLHHVAPGLGALVALGMFSTPLKEVMHIRKTHHLGDFNPIPMIAIIANTAAWLIYGCVNKDPYVIVANEPGFLLGLFMTTSCYAFATPQVQDTMLQALVFFAALISGTSIYIALALDDAASQVQAAGYLAVTVLLLYYSSPLSVLYKVLSTRNSASLYWPLSVMCCVNAGLWVAYGLAVGDAFIYAPNMAGAALGLIQLFLIAVIPSRPESEEDVLDEEVRRPLKQPETSQ